MESIDIRKEVVAKFNARSGEFNECIDKVKGFAVNVLVDCGGFINEIPDAKTLVGLIIDEIDDRTNTGALDLIDGQLAKGIFEKWIESPKLEAEFAKIKALALAQIAANTPQASV